MSYSNIRGLIATITNDTYHSARSALYMRPLPLVNNSTHAIAPARANESDLVGQAVPSVSPGQAAQHFEKLDCFCFSQQTLAPGETKELPLTFIVKPEIDESIRTVTLSYAFFNVDGQK